MKLATRILILAGATLLPGILAGAYNEFALRRERAAEVSELAMRNTRQAAAFIEQVLQSVHSVLLSVAASDALEDPTRCSAYMRSLKGSLDYVGGLGLIGPSGVLKCASGSASEIDLSDRSYFKQVQATRAFHVGEYIEGRISHRPQLMTALPLPADGDKPAVLFASLDLSWLQKRIEQSDIPLGANVTVADRNGVIVVRNPQPERFIGRKIPDAFMHLVNAERAGTIEVRSQDGTTRILAYMPARLDPMGIYVSSGLSKEEAFRATDRSTVVTASVALASAALAMIVAVLLGRYFIAGPVGNILGVVDLRRQGRRDVRVGSSPKDGEIGAIGSALDRLFDEVDRREAQRDLLSKEIAHRVKNTLAIAQAIASQTLKQGAGGFESFSARLNALGKAYDVLLAGEWQASPISEVVRSATAPHQGPGQSRIAFSGDDTLIDARAVLALSLVFHELCTNAVKYGALSVPEGSVRITSSVGADGLVRLVWTEQDGPPVPQSRQPGFGTTLIHNAFPADLAASIAMSFPPGGVRCEVTFQRGTTTAGG